ncbi:MAG: type II toxin-antitoxin system HicB family antitoxin [Dehalococcoidia bacterium]|nr:MAG: type II toxin-antitoxin system HicB family antitoxin [Dehalococcoidia bacterium]
MKFKVFITTGEDGWYIAECPVLPGCVSQGKTVDQALENIKDAIEGCLEVLNERAVAKAEKASSEASKEFNKLL